MNIRERFADIKAQFDGIVTPPSHDPAAKARYEQARDEYFAWGEPYRESFRSRPCLHTAEGQEGRRLALAFDAALEDYSLSEHTRLGQFLKLLTGMCSHPGEHSH